MAWTVKLAILTEDARFKQCIGQYTRGCNFKKDSCLGSRGPREERHTAENSWTISSRTETHLAQMVSFHISRR